MKIEKAEPKPLFKPVTITLETPEEVISMRAIVAAAYRGKSVGDTMRLWGRVEADGKPQPKDADDFCSRLNSEMCNERLHQ